MLELTPGIAASWAVQTQRMYLDYWAIGARSLSRLVKGEPWSEATEDESRQRLRAPDFLANLERWLQSLLELSVAFKAAGLPTEWLDQLAANPAGQLAGNPWSGLEQTPHRVVLKQEGVRVRHYPTLAGPRRKSPLLIVYAPVNRYHILDMAPERSVVRQFASSGFDVFLLDWGDQRENKPTFSDYVDYIRQAVGVIQQLASTTQVHLLGYSWGGILSLVYAATSAKNVKSLVLQTVQVDTSLDDTVLANWIRKSPAEALAKHFRLVPGQLFDLAFLNRNPFTHLFDGAKYSWMMAEEPTRFVENALRMTGWMFNTPGFPAPFYARLAGHLYRDNALANGTFRPSDEQDPVRLENIRAPVLSIGATYDDFAPPACSRAVNRLVSSKDRSYWEFPTDHMGVSVGADAHAQLWPRAAAWLSARD